MTDHKLTALSEPMRRTLLHLLHMETQYPEDAGQMQGIHTVSALRGLGRRGLAVGTTDARSGYKLWRLADAGRAMAKAEKK